ncbi:hypothetical protein PPTG_03603 [Phytophthora nicotianae INRA-310]|uniref:Uncharacterized protein n=1 Tax=Phytophthora nicotianae (strain INRA-310) TaxID=761204 RepID=W2R5V2_PHYN3|nr:hypothetical protein PPTG_03603 [Phytophthora nicotianae INRA-310]ETN20641.1 hypothetical protein PPTG_03603 [Phytophthora nicotianae INRA-310]
MNPTDPDATSFFCFDRVDDHALAELDVGNRLEAWECALRLAMTAVLGPRTINEKKFTAWYTELVALGLEWDLSAMTVSMLTSKNQKTRSLRRVCSCIRPAKPFFQRSPGNRTITLTRDAELDLTWFEHILRFSRLRGVPLEFFSDLPDPNVHLYMDASDLGLCVLHPARRKFIRILFDDEDKVLIQQDKFSINLKEQLSAVLAVLCRGGQWSSHDRASLNHEMNTILGAAEAQHGLRISAKHLAGTSNYRADLGLRAWRSSQQLTEVFPLSPCLLILPSRGICKGVLLKSDQLAA